MFLNPYRHFRGTEPDGDNLLEVWWGLEDAGPDITDDSYNNRTVTENGSITFDEPGKVKNRKAVRFTTDSPVQFASYIGSFFSNYPFSFTGWFKIAADTGGPQFLVSIADNSASNVYYAVSVRGSGLMGLHSRNTTAYTSSGKQFMRDGQWHHFAAVFAANNDRKLYLNGHLETTNTNTSNYNTNADRVTIGAFDGAATDYFMDGWLDEVSVWNTALTRDNVLWLYNKSKGRTYSDLNTQYTQPGTGSPYTQPGTGEGYSR